MTVHVGVAGVSKAVSAIHVGVSGAWKVVTSGWVGVSGVWKKFYDFAVVAITDNVMAAAFMAGTSTAQYQLTSAGLERATQGTNTLVTLGTWLLSGAAADYEIRATLESGAVTSGPTNPTSPGWLSLSSTRTWSVQATAVDGSHDAELTIEVRRASDLAVLSTTTVTLQAERFA